MWRTAALGRRSSCSVQGDGSTHALVTATRVGLGLRPCARVRSCARESGGRRGRRVCLAVPAASASLGPAAAVLGKGRSQPQKRRLLLSGPWAQASLATAAGAPDDSVPAGAVTDRRGRRRPGARGVRSSHHRAFGRRVPGSRRVPAAGAPRSRASPSLGVRSERVLARVGSQAAVTSSHLVTVSQRRRAFSVFAFGWTCLFLNVAPVVNLAGLFIPVRRAGGISF